MAEGVKLCCAACGQMNRVPAARLAAGPKCGVCEVARLAGARPAAEIVDFVRSHLALERG